MVDGVNFEIKGNSIFFKIDLRVYPLSAVYSAGYVFIDKCYVLLDRLDPSILQIELNLIDFSSDKLDILRKEFSNELLKFSFHTQLSEKTADIQSQIVQSALNAGAGAVIIDESELEKELENIGDFEVDDPDGIAVPWDEKYGSDSDKKEE